MERKIKQKAVAENSAPIFARPAPASTPTGWSSTLSSNNHEKESWPGVI
jgi:hypothetical protein